MDRVHFKKIEFMIQEELMILACHNLDKSFGEQVIVRNGSFHIEEHEKAALVGINGAGKSTILKMIVKELPADSGEVILSKGKQIGYLSQHPMTDTSRTIYEEVKTAKQYLIDMETQIRSIELELKSLTGDALDDRLASYHNLMARFEREDGYAYESEIVGVLKGLGFLEEDFTKPVSALSGGQKLEYPSANFCSLNQTSCFSMSPPTILISIPSPGLRHT